MGKQGNLFWYQALFLPCFLKNNREGPYFFHQSNWKWTYISISNSMNWHGKSYYWSICTLHSFFYHWFQFRKLADLEPIEVTFLLLAFVSIVGACIITVVRVNDADKGEPDSTFGILLLINLGKLFIKSLDPVDPWDRDNPPKLYQKQD